VGTSLREKSYKEQIPERLLFFLLWMSSMLSTCVNAPEFGVVLRWPR
jgi:hypothetical protein